MTDPNEIIKHLGAQLEAQIARAEKAEAEAVRLRAALARATACIRRTEWVLGVCECCRQIVNAETAAKIGEPASRVGHLLECPVSVSLSDTDGARAPAEWRAMEALEADVRWHIQHGWCGSAETCSALAALDRARGGEAKS